MTSALARVNTITPATIGGIKIQRVVERRPHFNMLVYGDSGTGKTYLAGTAYAVPEMQRMLFIDIEGGSLTLRKDFPNIETVRIESWKQMQELYDALRAGGHGFNTVALDSLTEIQKFNMDQIMLKLIEGNDERDMDVPSLREWGKNLEQIRRFVRAFRDLPLNVIFTALRRIDKDRLNRPINMPSLSGKMAGEVAAFLDIVLYYSIKEVDDPDGPGKKQLRVLQSAATESTTAKDRSGLLPPVMVGPTMEQLYDAIVRRTGGSAFEQPKEVITDAVVVEEAKNEPVKAEPTEDEIIASMNRS